MSTGLECEFIEVKPGEWWYLLEHGNAPKLAYDWRDYASAYGPFSDFETANRHLRDNHANPGGFSVQEYEEGFEPDETLAALISS